MTWDHRTRRRPAVANKRQRITDILNQSGYRTSANLGMYSFNQRTSSQDPGYRVPPINFHVFNVLALFAPRSTFSTPAVTARIIARLNYLMAKPTPTPAWEVTSIRHVQDLSRLMYSRCKEVNLRFSPRFNPSFIHLFPHAPRKSKSKHNEYPHASTEERAPSQRRGCTADIVAPSPGAARQGR